MGVSACCVAGPAAQQREMPSSGRLHLLSSERALDDQLGIGELVANEATVNTDSQAAQVHRSRMRA
jgi:hypothetical protein